MLVAGAYRQNQEDPALAKGNAAVALLGGAGRADDGEPVAFDPIGNAIIEIFDIHLHVIEAQALDRRMTVLPHVVAVNAQ